MLNDKQLITQALEFWANNIETGDPAMSAITAEKVGKKEEINVLTHDQMKFVIRLRELASKTLTGGSPPAEFF